MIDLHSARNAFDSKRTFNLGFIGTHNNTADRFTKLIISTPFQEIIESSKAYFPVERWFHRTKDDTRDFKSLECES